ncbi:MAG: beta-lactamase family protein [Pseudomonadales bacterium]|jgi:CubicO group peptidase (beta-lactamase class C family)|nr:beta-lactamase family protein [Pseudomonadales bacterium]
MTNDAYSSANWNQAPHNRHSFQHMSALFASQTVHQGTGPAAAFEYALKDLSQLTYPVSKGATESLQHFLDSSFTDAFLVLKEGVIVTEDYRNNMQASSRHLLNSVSKSFVGMLAGIAVEDGLLDTSKYVSAYLPELTDSAFRATTVQRALDMTAAVAFSEDYDQATDDFWHEAAVVGWRPDLQSDSSPRSLIDYCKERSQTEQGEGERFHYRTVLTNLCTAVIERATGTPFCEFFSRRLWQPLGPEQDASVVVDPTGLPYMGAGMSACTRDLARFGEMLRNDGFYNDQQILPASWVRDTRLGNDELRELFAASDYHGLLPNGHYTNQVWADRESDEIMCIGIHGQTIYIHRSKQLVCVKLSSHPYPTDLGLWGATYRALRALAAQI